MSELFDPILAAGSVQDTVSDAAWLQAILTAEAALARAAAQVGLMPVSHAERIAEACTAELYDVAEIGRAATKIGNPVEPLVAALTARVAAVDSTAAGSVHRGATSQDILDTAAMLVARAAFKKLLAQLASCTERLAALAAAHAYTPQVGRTLLQQAVPVSFGYTASGWLSALDRASERIEEVRESRLAAQLGGAAGTLASLGDAGPEVLAAFAHHTGLVEPVLAWHTERGRVADLAGALAVTCGAVAKIARDVTLLAQTEVAEVEEVAARGGGSSTMPHKRNPIAAVLAAAAAAQAPGLMATLYSAAAQEYQRAAGSWHAEWRPFTELVSVTGSALHWLNVSLDRLRVHPQRMRVNLETTGGLLLAERITTALTDTVGRLVAHDAVTACARRHAETGADFAELLADHPVLRLHVNLPRIHALLAPNGYVTSAASFVDRALAAHRHRIPAENTLAVEVHYRVDGPADGPAILFANSIGSDLRIWDDYVKPLTDKGFRVIRHDLRGHGDSPVPAGPYRIEEIGGDALTLLHRLGIDRAHIVGISIGGMLGLWLARHHPARVRSLTVCCSSAYPGNRQMWLDRATQVRAEGMETVADGSVTRWFTAAWRTAHPERAQAMRALTADTPAEGYASCCELLAELDLTADLQGITAPTLVISGADDAALPPEHSRLIAAGIPHASHEIVRNAAHLGTVERPAEFLHLIDNFLGENR